MNFYSCTTTAFSVLMFSSRHLFQNVQCPEYPSCTRQNCIFSHRADLPSPPPLIVSSNEVKAASTSTRQLPSAAGPSVVPTKRASVSVPPRTFSNPVGEPPRKLQAIGTGTGVGRKQNPTPQIASTSSVSPIIAFPRSNLTFQSSRQAHLFSEYLPPPLV